VKDANTNQPPRITRRGAKHEHPSVGRHQVAQRPTVGVGLAFAVLAGVWLLFSLFTFQ
jgi:hypothetical protein